MKKERIYTVVGFVVNILITIIKIFSGIVFSSYTLMVGGYYTLTDIAHEFIAYSGSLARGRRASKKEPFGYGFIESLSICLFGAVLIAIAVYVLIKSCYLNYTATDIRLIFIVGFLFVFKFLSANIIFAYAKSIQSQMLMESAISSYKDSLTSIGIFLLIFISFKYPLVDQIGSIFMGILIMLKGIKIIIDNIILIKGQNDNVKTINNKLKKIVATDGKIMYSNSNLINVLDFYKVDIEILVDDEISIYDLLKWQRKIKRIIKKEKLNIKFIEFTVYKK